MGVMLLAVGETAWDSSYKKPQPLSRSVAGFESHTQSLHLGCVHLLLAAAPWLAAAAPSKQIGAEQLPSTDGTFERSTPGSVLLPVPSASDSRLGEGAHKQSWSLGGVAPGRDLQHSGASGSAIFPVNAAGRLPERARSSPCRFSRLEIH